MIRSEMSRSGIALDFVVGLRQHDDGLGDRFPFAMPRPMRTQCVLHRLFDLVESEQIVELGKSRVDETAVDAHLAELAMKQ